MTTRPIRSGLATILGANALFFACTEPVVHAQSPTASTSTRSAHRAAPVLMNAAEILAAARVAPPGAVLIMRDGVWMDEAIQFESLTGGTQSMPITLRPQTLGGATLQGSSTLHIHGSFLVVEGLSFDGGALNGSNGQKSIVEFRSRSNSTEYARNCRLTNCSFTNYNPPLRTTRYSWVSLYGDRNRVDHCHFENQTHEGVTVVVWRPDDSVDFHRIDHNEFRCRPEGSDSNGWETIRIGTSTQSLSNSNTTVEFNLFEKLDGEIEIISNKSGSNTFRCNTFRDCGGTLTLRHGNKALVDGNFFLGNPMASNTRPRSGGVRVIGESHQVTNNYFESIDDRAGGVISVSGWRENAPLDEYLRTADCLIAHNTIVDALGPMMFFSEGATNDRRGQLAENFTVVNNVFLSSTGGPAIFAGAIGLGWNWSGNILRGTPGGAPPVGIVYGDPQLVQVTGLYRLASSSFAKDRGSLGFATRVPSDMDGQARADGLPDVGADEVSSDPTTCRPLTATDVGPSWH